MATLKSRFRLIIGVDFEDLYSVDNLVSADGESRAALQMVVGGGVFVYKRGVRRFFKVQMVSST